MPAKEIYSRCSLSIYTQLLRKKIAVETITLESLLNYAVLLLTINKVIYFK